LNTEVGEFGIQELAARIDRSPRHSPSLANRKALASAIENFHRRCNYAPATLGITLDTILNGGIIVRLAHQPNFLPYDNLLLQIRYLHQLDRVLTALGHNVVILVLLVDHDIGSNKRFGRSELIDARAPDLLGYIDFPIREPYQLIVNQPLPSVDFMRTLSQEIAEIGEALSANGDSYSARSADAIQDDLAPAVLDSINTTHMTAFSWMRIAYHFGFAPKVVFASLSDLSAHLRPFYLDLSARIGPDESGFEQFWILCPVCGGRSRVTRSVGQYHTQCTNCRKEENIQDPSKDETLQIVPRVLVDILSDYSGLDISGGTAYASGLPKILISHSKAAVRGIRTKPEAVWRSDVLHTGPAGAVTFSRMSQHSLPRRLYNVLVTGRMSLAYYLSFPRELDRLRDAFDAKVQSQEFSTGIDLHPEAPTSLRKWLHLAQHQVERSN
jgi:hypothetical protein